MQRRGCQGKAWEVCRKLKHMQGQVKGEWGRVEGKVEEEFQGNGESAWGRHGKSGRE